MILKGGTFLSSSSPMSWHSTKWEPPATCSSMISNLPVSESMSDVNYEANIKNKALT